MFFIRRKFIAVCFSLALVLPAVAIAGAGDAGDPGPDAVSANQKGLAHFKHGYYDLVPRGRKAEAHEELALAEKAFQRAITFNEDFIDAHRNLARLYYLQEKFEQARNEFAKIMRLDPGDIDSYVQMALAEIELENFQEAIRHLEAAKQQTDDPKIIRKLDGYIQKILLAATVLRDRKGGGK